ncbi:phage tail protein [Spartinivicinus poritis]|uniref:Phage tail protein n=1 Tax=Spartinivicinus poritis TaxID=2994640 RepID=A0ABT5UB08_9GAMM|nr:phage tail protein [Spartinivicinus sp. A2-2]MDE1463365.1 phage tail protein [Spartinivicinus sp. A2-2]
MENKFYSIFTDIGKAQLANATALGQTLNISKIKIGDGGDDNGAESNPKETDTDIVRGRWEGPINDLKKHPKNDKWLVTETIIPDTVGNFYITEFGLYDDQDNLIVIGKYPKTYKPTLEEGSASSSYIKVIIELANSDTIQLKVDPTIMLASKEYVDQELALHKQQSNPHPQYALQLEHLSKLPFYPEVLNSDNKLQVKKVSNKIVVLPNQVICWRGWKDFSTSDYTAQQRTFVVDDTKTYHLRWAPEQGFKLFDVKDLTYNPTELPEENIKFDTTYDDMLVALIKNGKIKLLINAIELSKETILNWMITQVPDDLNPSGVLKNASYINIKLENLNWSRRPFCSYQGTTDALEFTSENTTVLLPHLISRYAIYGIHGCIKEVNRESDGGFILFFVASMIKPKF